MKQKNLYLLAGVPGSGKSTWLKWHAPDNSIIISRDQIRFSLLQDGEDYFAHESEVYFEFINQINDALENEYSDAPIFVDATHLTKASRAKLLKRLFKEDISTLSIYWFDVPLKTCFERNDQRSGLAKVTRKVIRRMFYQKEFPTLEEGIDKIFIINEKGEINGYN